MNLGHQIIKVLCDYLNTVRQFYEILLHIYVTCKRMYTVGLEASMGPYSVCASSCRTAHILSCQPRVTVTSCFVYRAIRDL